MDFIDEVKKVSNQKLRKDVIAWIERINLNQTILDSSKEGFTGHKISLNGDFLNDRERKDAEFLKMANVAKIIEEELGKGFKVLHDSEEINTIFGVVGYRKYLIIRWG